ncbi:MAG: type II toxin-antitoxin system HicB family antitoxin, partial [Gammaproteobacteria bacterium]
MQYPIFIHKDEASDFGSIVPDLPGCFSAGSSIEEVVKNTREAIECHLEGLLLDNEAIPLKKPIEQHLDNPDFKEGV